MREKGKFRAQQMEEEEKEKQIGSSPKLVWRKIKDKKNPPEERGPFLSEGAERGGEIKGKKEK